MDKGVDPVMLHMLKGRAVAASLLSVLICVSILLQACGNGEKPEENGEDDQGPSSTVSDSSYVEEGDSVAVVDEEGADVSFTDIDSVTFSLSEFRGSIVMVDFWRTDSEPCIERLETVKELFSEFRDSDFNVISVAMDPVNEDKLRLIRQRYKLPFPVVRGDGKIGLDPWLLSSLPVSFIHDRDGGLAARIVGPQEKEIYEERIRALLGDSQDPDTVQR